MRDDQQHVEKTNVKGKSKADKLSKVVDGKLKDGVRHDQSKEQGFKAIKTAIDVVFKEEDEERC